MKNAKKDFKPGSNPDPKTLPPPPPGCSNVENVFTPLPDPGGRPKYRWATCIKVFQSGKKVMEFCAESYLIKVVSLDKDHIVFYDEWGKRVELYINDGIIYVKYKEKEEHF